MGRLLTSDLPLVVDMDHTLLLTDTTATAFRQALATKPFSALAALGLFARGRAYFKHRITELGQLDIEALPLRLDFVAFLESERARGRRLHLVSGADHSVVHRVAARLGLFETAQGSAAGRNLVGAVKAAYLKSQFGAFVYAGDSRADLHVWRHAEQIILVGAAAHIARRARLLGSPIEAEF